jgi:hypothetical protein
MSKETAIADIVIHLHPDASGDEKAAIETETRALDGVVSVHFSGETHPHAMIVAYNPDQLSSEQVLESVRRHDSKAVMAGF